jgi:translation initiation factor IF-3-like protein/SUKH-4 immunity protein of toxin-antitoxin system
MSRTPARQKSPVNSEITVPTVQVEVRWGPKLGIMSTSDALHEARRRGLDLVLHGPLAKPPFCEIMDMSGYVYNDELAAHSLDVPRPTIEPLAHLPIPSDSKRFLAHTGLPARFCEFRLDYDRNGLLRLDRYSQWWRQIEQSAFESTCRRLGRELDVWRYFLLPNPTDLSQYYWVGEMDTGMTLSIEQVSGRVISIDIAGFQGYSPPVFINSSVTMFAQFITIFTAANEEDRPTIRARLCALDPKAMEERDQGFWSPLVEEFEAGMS